MMTEEKVIIGFFGLVASITIIFFLSVYRIVYLMVYDSVYEANNYLRSGVNISTDTTKDGTNSNITLDTTNEKLGTGCYDFSGSTSRSVTSVKFNALHDNTDEVLYHFGCDQEICPQYMVMQILYLTVWLQVQLTEQV